MNRGLLEKPFGPEQIRRRQGRNGMLDYVEGHSVIQRLNDALDGGWSFEITHHEVREDEVIVLGKLTAESIAKMAFGTSQVTRERESGQLVSLGDDLKAASTDAMKKCATFLGWGCTFTSTSHWPATRRDLVMPATAARQVLSGRWLLPLRPILARPTAISRHGPPSGSWTRS